jgi:ANTAR domain/GAF domain
VSTTAWADDNTGALLAAAVTAFHALHRESAAPSSDALTALTTAAVRAIPHAELASITVRRQATFYTATATDDRALQADQMQYQLESGPCVDAIIEDTLFRLDDVGHDERWPTFGRRAAAELGIASMLSLRLGVGESDLVAGLNLYSDQPAAFDGNDLLIGELLTTHGALAVTAAAQRRRADKLQRAVESNRDIGTAVGILMTRHKTTREKAFDLLRIASQHQHRKLREVALDVIHTGELTPEPGSGSR